MSDITVQVKIDTTKLQRLLLTLPGRVDDVIGKVANDAVAAMADAMDEPKSGRTYRRGAVASKRKANKGQTIGYKFHRASAPGEAPAVDTGHLKSTLHAKRVKAAVWLVYAGAEYAPSLEFGTGSLAPRPFFVNGIEQAGRGLVQAVGEVIE